MQEFAAQVDARKYEPKVKHALISKTFNSLKNGEKIELINDHHQKG